MSRIPFFLKSIIGKCGYSIFKLNMKLTNRQIKVVDEEKTIKSIVRNRASISRYGDGEFLWIFQKRADGNFEINSPKLSQRLKEVLTKPCDNLLIGIPRIFNNVSHIDKRGRVYWEGFLIRNGNKVLKLLDHEKLYYSSQFTRPYIDFLQSNTNFNTLFKLEKQIWNRRNVLIVEGKKTRFGVGSDLLDNAKSVKRIICPEKNSFEKYDQIYKNVDDYISFHTGEDLLILLALGPTATVLVYDITKKNKIQAVDIGHLDVEYQWYKMKATKKVSVPGRYIEESAQKFSQELPESILKRYRREIIEEIN